MAFCEQCGNKINDGAKFCDKCGAPFSSGQDENMSAPAACTQCGAPLAEGEVFCANCGAKVGAVQQYQSAPAQTQGQDVSGEVLREGKGIMWMPTGKDGEGLLLLYGNRLEWKGKTNFVIPIEKISSVKLIHSNSDIKITLDGKNEYVFSSLYYNTSTDSIELHKPELESWLNAINSVRSGTLA